MKSLRIIARPISVVAISLVLLCGLAAVAETNPALSKKDVKALLASANTPADHEKIASYYHEKALHLNAKAKELSAQADFLATQPATVESKQGISCLSTSHFRYWAKIYTEEAKNSEALATQHDQIAKGSQPATGLVAKATQK
ncbi:MAG: hypothetical protein ACLPLR_13725 [Terriglobales bacterium]